MNEMGERKRLPVFEMIYVAGLAALLIYAIFFMNTHRVGVLDVARVARETGVLERMHRESRHLQEEARERLGKLQQAHLQKIDDLNRKLKSAGSESEKKRVQGEIESQQEAFQQSLTAARQSLQRHEAQMFATFRKRLMPHVEKIARKRRLDIVIDPTTTVLVTPKAPDITAAVVDAVREILCPPCRWSMCRCSKVGARRAGGWAEAAERRPAMGIRPRRPSPLRFNRRKPGRSLEDIWSAIGGPKADPDCWATTRNAGSGDGIRSWKPCGWASGPCWNSGWRKRPVMKRITAKRWRARPGCGFPSGGAPRGN